MRDNTSVRETFAAASSEAAAAARLRQDSLAKPPGSLGRLEELSIRLAAITGRPPRQLRERVVFVLAADHGVAAQGVSAYPASVTRAMVETVLSGRASVSVLARTFGARVVVADFGVAEPPSHPDLRRCAPRAVSDDISEGPAMTRSEAQRCVAAGRSLVRETANGPGLDVVCLGELGIGNTTPSAALICHFTRLPPDLVVGRGTGVDDAGLQRKREVVARTLEINRERMDDPVGALAAVGGFEIAGLVGVILEANERHLPIVLDGFISVAAALCAAAIEPATQASMLAAHRSAELGCGVALDALGLRPLLDLDLRLGEGTGAVLALPLLDAAVAVYGEVATLAEVLGEEGADGGR